MYLHKFLGVNFFPRLVLFVLVQGGSGTAVGPGLHLRRTYTLQPEVCHQTIHLTLRGSGTALGPGLQKQHDIYITGQRNKQIYPRLNIAKVLKFPLLSFVVLYLLNFCFDLFVTSGEFLALPDLVRLSVFEEFVPYGGLVWAPVIMLKCLPYGFCVFFAPLDSLGGRGGGSVFMGKFVVVC